MGLTNEISMSYCRDISRGKRPGKPQQKETKMSNAQIALKPVLVADLHIGSEIDGLPLIEKFTNKGNEFYDEWVTALTSNMLVVEDVTPLNAGKVEVYFNASDTPVILHKTEQVLMA